MPGQNSEINCLPLIFECEMSGTTGGSSVHVDGGGRWVVSSLEDKSMGNSFGFEVHHVCQQLPGSPPVSPDSTLTPPKTCIDDGSNDNGQQILSMYCNGNRSRMASC